MLHTCKVAVLPLFDFSKMQSFDNYGEFVFLTMRYRNLQYIDYFGIDTPPHFMRDQVMVKADVASTLRVL
jgi:hypothetical protein